jgi:cobalt-zinc-cadmium resistance protein CzcA
MLAHLLGGALSQRLLVLVIALVFVLLGIRAATKLTVDAFPDVTNVQVQIATEAQGRSPEEVERFITVPLEIAMTGLPGLTEMRALNRSGLSIVTLVFSDRTDVYFARQLVMERLLEVGSKMPEGIVPVLGPVSTGLGEVYQYTLVHPDDGNRRLSDAELMERRVVQDWVVRPLLRSIPGVAEINTQGGLERQFQVLVDPDRLRAFRVSLSDVEEAIRRNNANSGGGVLPITAERYLIRGIGLIKSETDIGNIILKENANVPVFIRDVASVNVGSAVRHGAIIKNGVTEGVAGIVMMLRGGNAKEVVGRVKAKVDEINSGNLLPGGLKIEPFYDRTELVDSALWMVTKVLLEGILFIVIILYIFLGDIRSSVVVIATIIITPLVTFIAMNAIGLSANLMSLGGLAIAIGLMVDGTVVVVENVYHKLGHAGTSKAERVKVILEATAEVAKPTIYGISIIILVFIPLMALTGMEGKMFGPLALTIAISLAVSLIVSLFLSPVLCSWLLKGGQDHDTRPIAWMKRLYLKLLN